MSPFDMVNNRMEVHQNYAEPWRVTLVDTGEETLTGGRLKRVAAYLQGETEFCFTYGDGVSDVDIAQLIDFHRSHGKWATVTAVRPPGRYGALQLAQDRVAGFTEKPPGDGGSDQRGIFCSLAPTALDLISGDMVSWEGDPWCNWLRRVN
jgi:glucose-1-phosphate cytidylyltransferase